MGVDYYAVLEILRTASPEEIRRGYARTAIRCHPERPFAECPPEDQELRHNWFQLAAEAYEVLSQPLLKAAYDKFGEAGLKNGVPSRDSALFFPPFSYHGDAMKTYREFFGTESPSEPVLLEWQSNFQTRRPDGKIGPWFREQPEEVTLPLSLETVMKGGEAEAVMMRREIKNGVMEIKEHRIKLNLNPGVPNGSGFLFPRKGHQAPYSIPGDVLVVTKDLPHPIFTRERNDLIVNCKVTLTEALLGCTVQVPTLDGRVLRINVTDVITPDYEMRISGEGMPVCAKVYPPPPIEPPSRKCCLVTPGWVSEDRFYKDCQDKMGPCSTCGQTADCHDFEGSRPLEPRTLLPAINEKESMDLLYNNDSSRGSYEYRSAEDIKKKASFDRPEVESARIELLRRFPHLFDSKDVANGDLVLRFQIEFPAHVPGHRRTQIAQALDQLIEQPERRIIFNKKY